FGLLGSWLAARAGGSSKGARPRAWSGRCAPAPATRVVSLGYFAKLGRVASLSTDSARWSSSARLLRGHSSRRELMPSLCPGASRPFAQYTLPCYAGLGTGGQVEG